MAIRASASSAAQTVGRASYGDIFEGHAQSQDLSVRKQC